MSTVPLFYLGQRQASNQRTRCLTRILRLLGLRLLGLSGRSRRALTAATDRQDAGDDGDAIGVEGSDVDVD